MQVGLDKSCKGQNKVCGWMEMQKNPLSEILHARNSSNSDRKKDKKSNTE